LSNYTITQLRAMTPSERHTLYKNARRIGGAKAEAVIALLEEAGLPYSEDSCVSLDDPIVLKMHEVVNSEQGLAAMLDAFSKGLPPLAGVDPLIASTLGVDYGKHNMTTNTAGALVVERMSAMGFRKIEGQTKALPRGCVARSGVLFRKKNT